VEAKIENQDLESTVAKDLPEEKNLRTASFVVHATRGIIRDQNSRRKMMLALLALALAFLISGSTFLQGTLNPHEHALRFLLFWAICGLFAVTATLLAIFDFLIMKLEARKAERELREKLRPKSEDQIV
jgi:hypothetical protein